MRLAAFIFSRIDRGSRLRRLTAKQDTYGTINTSADRGFGAARCDQIMDKEHLVRGLMLKQGIEL